MTFSPVILRRAARLSRIRVWGLALLLAVCAALAGHAASSGAVEGKHGMVVSADSLASAAGAEVLRKGGNAIDAAVATAFALAVTYPEAGNIGGGGFMLIRRSNGTSMMIDFREKAPAGATRNMFLDSAGNPVPGKSLYGPLASGVPGTVAGLLTALEHYGSKPRADVMRAAIRLAREGFPVSTRLAASLRFNLPDSLASAGARRIFKRDGAWLEPGDLLRQPDLASTLELIRRKGTPGFYKGKVAALIASEAARGGGIITRADLAAYHAVERRPLKGTYRGFEIIAASPPSAGGITLLEMLNILERFNLRSKGHNSAGSLHLIAAAAQHAYADRAQYIGDPDFVNVPVAELISKTYGERRAREIDSTHASPASQIHGGLVGERATHQTTHFCTADRWGNVVSTTVTLNDNYGSRTLVEGAGFFLNDEMDDFVAKPGAPNMFGLVGGDFNAIAPNKRMLSSMTPTIVLKNGKPWLIVGARGGGRISTAVAQVIVNLVDFKLPVQEAIDAPRIHNQWRPDEVIYERDGLPPAVVDSLRSMGYTMRQVDEWNGRAHAIMIAPAAGLFIGAPDPREQGVAVGY